MTSERTLWHADQLNAPASGARNLWLALLFGREVDSRRQVMLEREANLVSSITAEGRHIPVIDLDIPHRLIPSSTPGHSHLYLDVETSWPRYVVLLLALRLCGVIERGHCFWSIRRGATFVRLPGIRK